MPVAQQAADLVWLRNRIRIRGAVLGLNPDGTVRVVVRRAWLEQHARSFYEEVARDESQEQRVALEQLRDRVRGWLQERKEPSTLVAFLERELKRVEERLAALGDAAEKPSSQLLVVDVPKIHIRRYYFQAGAHRHVLLLAWQHRLREPEERPAADLGRELKAQQVDPDTAQADLSDRLPPQPTDERQWAARVGLVEYAFLAKPHFQGSGGYLVRADDGTPRPSVDRLFAGLLENYLGELLELAGTPGKAKDASITKALGEAAEGGFRGVRITRIQQEIPRRVTVSTRFLARMPDGSWQLLWQQTHTAELARGRPDLEDRVRNDPQVKKVFESLNALGLGADENLLEQAVRVGAATLEAESAVSAGFQQMLSAALGPLDAPLMWLSGAGVARDAGQ